MQLRLLIVQMDSTPLKGPIPVHFVLQVSSASHPLILAQLATILSKEKSRAPSAQLVFRVRMQHRQLHAHLEHFL